MLFRSYLAAALACTLVVCFYMEYQLGGQTTAVFGAGLLSVYAILYLVILSEDYAFISGAMVLFLSLAAVMMVTRKVDWSNWNGDIPGESASDTRIGEQA